MENRNRRKVKLKCNIELKDKVRKPMEEKKGEIIEMEKKRKTTLIKDKTA